MPRKLKVQLWWDPARCWNSSHMLPLPDCRRVSTSYSENRVPRETLTLSLTHETAGSTLSYHYCSPTRLQTCYKHFCLYHIPEVFKPLCSFWIKAQEEQASPPKGGKQKSKEKPEQVRDASKEKRRAYSVRKGLSGGASGNLAPMSDLDQNSFDGEHSQEKFIR